MRQTARVIVEDRTITIMQRIGWFLKLPVRFLGWCLRSIWIGFKVVLAGMVYAVLSTAATLASLVALSIVNYDAVTVLAFPEIRGVSREYEVAFQAASVPQMPDFSSAMELMNWPATLCVLVVVLMLHSLFLGGFLRISFAALQRAERKG